MKTMPHAISVKLGTPEGRCCRECNYIDGELASYTVITNSVETEFYLCRFHVKPYLKERVK